MNLDPGLLGLAGVFVSGFVALWYKMGKVESRVDDHIRYHRNGGQRDRAQHTPD